MSIYRLTKEGKDYLENGLPEKNLVDLLKKGSISLSEAGKKIDNFNVALLWTKKKGWAELKLNNLILVKYPEVIPEQEALEKINKEEDVKPDILNALIQRKLVEKVNVGLEEVRKLEGKETMHVTKELIKTGVWRQVKFKPFNVKATGEKVYPGKRHPYVQFLQQVRQKLIELGFKEMTGPSIELEFWNFDTLYQPQNHPARDWTSTYSLKHPKSGKLPAKSIVNNVKNSHENGWKTGSTGWQYTWNPRKAMQLMPRAHATALSARTLTRNPEIPGKYFAMVRCYRPDVIDATHGVEFYQTDGIILDDSLNFKKLLGILKMFAIEIAGAEKVKFVNDYYPFTEPSTQLSAKHPELGWIEFGGSGIFRPEVTESLGIKVPVLAWGIGIDRLAMFKLGINDVRGLFTKNLEWLRNQKVII